VLLPAASREFDRQDAKDGGVWSHQNPEDFSPGGPGVLAVLSFFRAFFRSLLGSSA